MVVRYDGGLLFTARDDRLATTLSIFALSRGFQAISEGNGFSIAVTGMLIVFFALTLISIFLRLLPVVLDKLEPILPRLESHTQPPTAAEQMPTDEESIIAAIGYVLHLEMEKAAQSK